MRRRHESRGQRVETNVKHVGVPSTALEPARRASTPQPPHQQAEIEGARVHEEPF